MEIGPFVTIDKNVIIGEEPVSDLMLPYFQETRIGKNCNIFPGAVIGAVPQDLKFAGERLLSRLATTPLSEICNNQQVVQKLKEGLLLATTV